MRAKREMWGWAKVVICIGTIVLGRGIQPIWLFWALVLVLSLVLGLSERHERTSRDEEDRRRKFSATVRTVEASGVVGISQWISNDMTYLERKREDLYQSLANSDGSAGTFLHTQRAIHKKEDRTSEEFLSKVEKWYQTANELRNQRIHGFISVTAATSVVFKISNQSQSAAGMVRFVLEIPKDVLVWTRRATSSDLRAGLNAPASYNRQTIVDSFASLSKSYDEMHLPLLGQLDLMTLSENSDHLVATQEFENVHSLDEILSAPLYIGTIREIDTLTLRWRLTSSILDDAQSGNIELVVRPGIMAV